MDHEALRGQQQRGLELRSLCRAVGDRSYDPGVALLRRFHPVFMRFTGHTVAQRSVAYAILLLHSDDRIYGTDDAGEANRIIRTILSYQDLRQGSDTYGNFFWMTHWDRVKDKNAVSFLTTPLAYIYLNFRDKLDSETRKALLDAFPAVVTGLRSHRVRWEYSNIFFLNLGGLVSVAAALGDPAIHGEAVELFNEWLDGTSKDGLHEFNSPAYSAVTLHGLEAAWASTPDQEFRRRLERTLDIFSYQAAVNLLPNGFVGGSYARADNEAIMSGPTGLSAFAHVKFGTPLVIPPDTELNVMWISSTLFDYVPPSAVRQLARNKAPAVVFCDRVRSLGSVRTHLMTPTYSLASQTLRSVGGHSPPPYVMLARNVPRGRCSVPIVPDESFSHQPCALFDAHQEGSRLVGRLYYELSDEIRSKFLADHTFRCEPRVLFGKRDHDVRGVRVGNVDWAGGDVQLQPGQPVSVWYGDLVVGVVALPVNRASGEPQAGHLHLGYGADEELRLCARIFGGPDLRSSDQPVDVVLLVDVNSDTASLKDYADWLAGWTLAQMPDGERLVVTAEHEDGSVLTSGWMSTWEENVLHDSPYLTLRAGDLQSLVCGEAESPLEETT